MPKQRFHPCNVCATSGLAELSTAGNEDEALSTDSGVVLPAPRHSGEGVGMDVIERGQLLADGWTDAEIQRLIRQEKLTRLAHGRYSDLDLAVMSPEERHGLVAVARWSCFTSPNVVLSHVSAAVLHGLPVIRGQLAKVCLTRSDTGGARTTKKVRVKASHLDVRDRVEIDGVPVTSVARTLIDLGRHHGTVATVIAADHALRHELVEADEVIATVLRMGTAPGLPTARRALVQADGRAESVGESRQHLVLRPAFPTYASQVNVFDERGTLTGRVDGALLEAGVVVEFDGFAKYERYRRQGESIGGAVAREKKREDRLRALGWLVVRFTWDELADPAAMIAKVRRAVAQRAGQPRPAGTTAVAPPRQIRF